MALFLLHQGRDGVPVGVWRARDDVYYPDDQKVKEAYGKSVMADMGTEVTWADWCERLASKIPGPTDQWDTVEADGTYELFEVLDEARASLTRGD